MAKAAQVRPHTPSQADRDQAIEGEIVEATERGLRRSDNADLDASLAVALSEAEINQQIATARRFPRPKTKAIDDLGDLACAEQEIAVSCIYSLPRGRDPETGRPKAIVGASIRFAELAAQCWGNNRVAGRVIAVDRREKFVEAEGIYHDLETNYAVSKRVRRRISGKDGRLFSDDMIIVTGNAAASIALRNAILAGIPRPVWGRAYERVEKTVAGDLKTVGVRRVELLTRFRDELGITAKQLFAALGVSGELDLGRDELIVASGFFSAIRNNETTIEDLLREVAPPSVGTRTLAHGHEAAPRPQGSPQTAESAMGAATVPAEENAGVGPTKEGGMVNDLDETVSKVSAAADAASAALRALDREYVAEFTRQSPAIDPDSEGAARIIAFAKLGAGVFAEGEGTVAASIAAALKADLGPLTTNWRDIPLVAKEPEDRGEEVQEGFPKPGETYLLASDDWGDSDDPDVPDRPGYRDGEPVGFVAFSTYRDRSIEVYEAHAPRPTPAPRAAKPKATKGSATDASDASPAPTESSPKAPDAPSSAGEPEGEQGQGETLQSPASSADSPALDGGLAVAVDSFHQRCAAAESWLQIKAALGALLRTPEFAALPDGLKDAERVFAYQHGAALAKAGRDPVSITSDPSFYRLWLLTEPSAAEVGDAFSRLVRSPDYKALKEEAKDEIAAATAKAQGDES